MNEDNDNPPFHKDVQFGFITALTLFAMYVVWWNMNYGKPDNGLHATALSWAWMTICGAGLLVAARGGQRLISRWIESRFGSPK